MVGCSSLFATVIDNIQVRLEYQALVNPSVSFVEQYMVIQVDLLIELVEGTNQVLVASKVAICKIVLLVVVAFRPYTNQDVTRY